MPSRPCFPSVWSDVVAPIPGAVRLRFCGITGGTQKKQAPAPPEVGPAHSFYLNPSLPPMLVTDGLVVVFSLSLVFVFAVPRDQMGSTGAGDRRRNQT